MCIRDRYIDDFNAVEKIYKKNPVHLFSTTKPASAVRAIKSEILYEEVKHRADSIGMRVNSKKTQLLCISAAGRADISTFATSPTDGTMHSSKSLKILRFHFGTRPNADAQVEHMKKKFYQRLWLLRHLVKNGLPEADIMAMYNCMIRPVLEFASPAFHSLLTVTQSGELEQLQSRAFKVVYGRKISYRSALALWSIKVGRSENNIGDNFAKKCLKNPRFTHWFPLSRETPYATRHKEKYLVKKSRTQRHQRNSLNYMRTRMNKASSS